MINEYRNAIENYIKALDLNPESAECHFNVASAYLDNGDPKKALYHFQKSLEYDPNNPEIHLNIASLMEKMGNKSKALEAYKQALNLNDSGKKALEGLKRLSKFDDESKTSN